MEFDSTLAGTLAGAAPQRSTRRDHLPVFGRPGRPSAPAQLFESVGARTREDRSGSRMPSVKARRTRNVYALWMHPGADASRALSHGGIITGTTQGGLAVGNGGSWNLTGNMIVRSSAGTFQPARAGSGPMILKNAGPNHYSAPIHAHGMWDRTNRLCTPS